MTRTYINTPQGRLPLISEEKAKWLRILRWGACIAAGFIMLVIGSAAVIGMHRAIHTSTSTDPIPAATKACANIPTAMRGNCIGLYLRPAYSITQKDGSRNDIPKGTELVKECISQYRGKELNSCLTQPIN